MQVCVIGASSQLARDFIRTATLRGEYDITAAVRTESLARTVPVLPESTHLVTYPDLAGRKFSAVINFVGAGSPSREKSMGEEISQITEAYDSLSLTLLDSKPESKYIFLSSGAVYGSDFSSPVGPQQQPPGFDNWPLTGDFYGAAKLATENRHRAMSGKQIFDLRVFSYADSSMGLDDGFLFTDLARAIVENKTFVTRASNFSRDYIGASDLEELIWCILRNGKGNEGIDVYSQAPTTKFAILSALENAHDLKVTFDDLGSESFQRGPKIHYYSLNRSAGLFGYQPKLSSLDLILEQIAALVERSK